MLTRITMVIFKVYSFTLVTFKAFSTFENRPTKPVFNFGFSFQCRRTNTQTLENKGVAEHTLRECGEAAGAPMDSTSHKSSYV